METKANHIEFLVKSRRAKVVVSQGDITTAPVETIVNPSNPQLIFGGGVAASILSKGGEEIRQEAREKVASKGDVKIGTCVSTGAGKLPFKCLIHTAGPTWKGGQANEEADLGSCVVEAMKLAETQGCRSIAIPAISTGNLGFPVSNCAKVFCREIVKYYEQYPQSRLEAVHVTIFDAPTFQAFKTEFEAQKGSFAASSDAPNGIVVEGTMDSKGSSGKGQCCRIF